MAARMPAQTQYDIYPAAELDARPRYFDGQFLGSQDFVDDQRYHIDRLRRHVHRLHVAGVAHGLVVSPDGPLRVKVSPGTAIDHEGRQIVAVTALALAIPPDMSRPAQCVVAVRYGERNDASFGGREGEPGTRGFTRVREEPVLELIPADAPLPAGALRLAHLSVAADGAIAVTTPAEVRRYSGLRLPGPGDDGPTLTTGGDPEPRLLRVSGDLRVRRPSVDGQWSGRIVGGGDTAAVSLGEFDGQAWLGAHDAALGGWRDLVINPGGGRVGVGTRAPQQTLHIGGRLAVDHGVIQRGGEPITSTSDLGLYSQVQNNWVRYVSRGGRHVFFNDGGIGTTADLAIESSGDAVVRALVRASGLAIGLGGANPRAAVEINAGHGHWLFLRQQRAAEGGGGFIVHNPWDAAGTPGGAPERNRLEIGYAPAAGDVRWSQFVLHGPSGRVGIGESNPRQTLHVRGRLALDDGVIQRGGEAITGTSELGLYSQVDGAAVRLVSRGGKHLFFTDGGAGTTAAMTLHETGLLHVRGNLTVDGLLLAGDVGWGTYHSRTQPRDNAGLRGDAGARSGFFDTGSASPDRNYPPGSSGWWHLLDVRHMNPNNNFAMQFAGALHDQRLWFRKTADNPATAWRRIPTTDDLGVTLDGRVGIGAGLTGTAAAPRAHLDIAQVPRTGTHPTSVPALYVTGEFGAASGGVEFRHSNGSQGVGIGFRGLYATGSNDHQDLALLPRGNGGVGVGTTEPGGRLDVRTGGVAGWDRVVVTTTTAWNGNTQALVCGGPGGGVMLQNPHVVWQADEKRASIRYAHTDANANNVWWDVGARGDGHFTIAARNSLHALRVQPGGNVGLGCNPEAGNRLQLGGGHLHLDGGSLLLRKGPLDQHALVRWNESTDRVDIGGWVGVTLGSTSAGPNRVTPTVEVVGNTTTFAGPLRGPATRPLQLQLVHRRVLFGLAGDQPMGFDSSSPGPHIRGQLIYGPFVYGAPTAQPGARRRFRVYAVYADNMTDTGNVEVLFRLATNWVNDASGGVFTFTLERTWGDPNHTRDCYSSWFDGQPPGHHGFIHVRTTVGGRVGRLYYLELQAYDEF